LTISFQGTSSPDSAFTRSKRIGFLSRESSIRKLKSVRRSPDMRDTGMFSSPNERAPLQMGLAISESPGPGGSSVDGQEPFPPRASLRANYVEWRKSQFPQSGWRRYTMTT